MIIPVYCSLVVDKYKIIKIDIPLYLNSDYANYTILSDSFFNEWFSNFDNPVIRYVPASSLLPFIQTCISRFLSQNPEVEFIIDNSTKIYDIKNLNFQENYDLSFVYRNGNSAYSSYAAFYIDVDFKSDDFETELYPELIDNEEIMLSLKNWVNDTGSWDSYTDKDIAAMKLIEKYNQNVLLLRSTKKTRVVNELYVDSGPSSISLSGVETKLQNINNSLNNLNEKFEVEEQIDGDVEIKTLTQVVKDLDLSNQTVVTTVESAPYNPLLSEGEDIYNI